MKNFVVDETFCSSCGAIIKIAAEICPKCGVRQKVDTSYTYSEETSEKSKTTVLLLCFFWGVLGIHRFYVGKTGTGILQIVASLLFVGVIWAIIDIIIIATVNFTDKEGKKGLNW